MAKYCLSVTLFYLEDHLRLLLFFADGKARVSFLGYKKGISNSLTFTADFHSITLNERWKEWRKERERERERELLVWGWKSRKQGIQEADNQDGVRVSSTQINIIKSTQTENKKYSNVHGVHGEIYSIYICIHTWILHFVCKCTYTGKTPFIIYQTCKSPSESSIISSPSCRLDN